MRTRSRFTTTNNTPITVNDRQHTMDRMAECDIGTIPMRDPVACIDWLRSHLSLLSGIPINDIHAHLEPITSARPDVAPAGDKGEAR